MMVLRSLWNVEKIFSYDIMPDREVNENEAENYSGN